MKTCYDVIVKPIITEKSMKLAATKKYCFQVATDATKIDIAKAVEEIFGVNVKDVNTMNVRGHEKRVGVHKGYTAKSRKAIVTLTESSKTIEVFESLV